MADPREGWERHLEERALVWLRLSPAERLAWLEEAKAFFARLQGAARRPGRHGPITSGAPEPRPGPEG